jgi:hypothetical protein
LFDVLLQVAPRIMPCCFSIHAHKQAGRNKPIETSLLSCTHTVSYPVLLTKHILSIFSTSIKPSRPYQSAMPTYNSLGISASLMVTDLDQTVSDKILLRMGAAQQRDTKRIQSQLYNGRALLEQHVSSQNCRGVLQFVGEDEDMALFIVEASHKQDDIDNAVRDIGIGKGQCSAKTNTAPTPTKETTQSYLQGVQGVTSCENNKSAANSQDIGNDSSGHHDRSKETKTIGQIAIPMEKSSNTQKQPKSLDSDTTDTLALCLKVDLTKYWQTVSKTSPLLHGADLKAEILINGHLVEAAYLNNRNNSRSELIHFTGTRFHRQVSLGVYN